LPRGKREGGSLLYYPRGKKGEVPKKTSWEKPGEKRSDPPNLRGEKRGKKKIDLFCPFGGGGKKGIFFFGCDSRPRVSSLAFSPGGGGKKKKGVFPFLGGGGYLSASCGKKKKKREKGSGRSCFHGGGFSQRGKEGGKREKLIFVHRILP